jgi:hypothetical protein
MSSAAVSVGAASRAPRAVKERQLALIEEKSSDLQGLPDREIQVDDDWEEKLNLQVKIMCVAHSFASVAELQRSSRPKCGSFRNVVGTVDLKTPLELKTIALHARNAEYNPKVSKRAMATTALMQTSHSQLSVM